MNGRTLITVFALAAQIAYSYSCCFPSQFEGLEGLSMGQEIDGKGSAVTALFKFSYDAKNQKAFSDGTAFVMGRPIKEQIFMDYANKKQYTVVNGKCTVAPLPIKQLACIPDGANKTLSTYQGIDDMKIDIDMYSFMYAGMYITMSVTKNRCAPMGEFIATKNAMINIGFLGLTTGIKNATVFNIPAACQKSSVSSQITVEQLKHTEHSSLFSMV